MSMYLPSSKMVYISMCSCFCLWHFRRLCTGHFMTLADLSDLYDKNSVYTNVLYISLFMFFFFVSSRTFGYKFSIWNVTVDGKTLAKEVNTQKKCDTWEHKNKAEEKSTKFALLVFVMFQCLNVCECAFFPLCRDKRATPKARVKHLMVFHNVYICYVITLARSSMFCSHQSLQFGIFGVAQEKFACKNALWTTNRNKLTEWCKNVTRAKTTTNTHLEHTNIHSTRKTMVEKLSEKSTWFCAKQQVFCQRFSDANLNGIRLKYEFAQAQATNNNGYSGNDNHPRTCSQLKSSTVEQSNGCRAKYFTYCHILHRNYELHTHLCTVSANLHIKETMQTFPINFRLRLGAHCSLSQVNSLFFWFDRLFYIYFSSLIWMK